MRYPWGKRMYREFRKVMLMVVGGLLLGISLGLKNGPQGELP